MVEKSKKTTKAKEEIKDITPIVNDPKVIIFDIQGGMGKIISSTAVVRGLRAKYPTSKIITVSSWSWVFDKNPDVYRNYDAGNTPYFYTDWVKDNQDSIKIFKIEPYSAQEHFLSTENNIVTMFKLCGLEYKGELPKVFFKDIEVDSVAMNIGFSNQQPIALVQVFGGTVNGKFNYNWTRDLHPIAAQKIVNDLKQKGFRVIQVKYKEQPQLQGAEPFTARHPRELIGLYALATKIVCTDSFSNHLATALGKQANVIWSIERQFKLFGYTHHNNIFSKTIIPVELNNKYGYLEEYSIGGESNFLGVNSIEIHNADDIIKEIK